MLNKNTEHKFLNFILLPLLLVSYSCGSQYGDSNSETKEEIYYSDNIIPMSEFLNNSFSKKNNTLEFKSYLVAPIPVASNDSSVVLMDFGTSQVKQFLLNGHAVEFNPLAEGPSKINGSFLKSIGFTEKSEILLIGTGNQIKKYNTKTNLYFDEEIDAFEECFSLSSVYSEVFYKKLLGDTLVISQNGRPCFTNEMFRDKISIEEYRKVNLLRVKSLLNGNELLTAKIPQESLILSKNELHIKTRFLLSHNEVSDTFFAMINPSPQLFEYKLSEDLHFELKRSINIQLPFSDQPIDYTFNNLNYTELASDNLKYNFEIKHMRTAGDYLVVSYRPSKSLEYQDISEAPHSSDYLLAVINIKEGKMKVFSLNFQETVYLGCTSKGDVFLYDVANSEKEGVTKVHIINVKEALNNNHPA